MVLFQQGRRFLQPLRHRLRVFPPLVAGTPLVLPMEREATEAEHAAAEGHQCRIGHAVQTGQPGGLPLAATLGEGALDQLQGLGSGRDIPAPAATGAP